MGDFADAARGDVGVFHNAFSSIIVINGFVGRLKRGTFFQTA